MPSTRSCVRLYRSLPPSNGATSSTVRTITGSPPAGHRFAVTPLTLLVVVNVKVPKGTQSSRVVGYYEQNDVNIRPTL